MPVYTNSITYHWAKPTPAEIRRRIIELSFDLENLSEPMTIGGEIARIDIQERFDTATSPDGILWDPWALSYEPWATEHTTGPIFTGSANLHLTGATKDAIGSRQAFVPTDEGLFIDTSGIPEWGMWNNFGAQRSVASGGASAEETKLTNIIVSAADKAAFGELSGQNELPARPFLGLSSKAEFKMDLAFYQWFDGEVALATSSRGKPFFRHAKRRGGTGPTRTQFAPIDD